MGAVLCYVAVIWRWIGGILLCELLTGLLLLGGHSVAQYCGWILLGYRLAIAALALVWISNLRGERSGTFGMAGSYRYGDGTPVGVLGKR